MSTKACIRCGNNKSMKDYRKLGLKNRSRTCIDCEEGVQTKDNYEDNNYENQEIGYNERPNTPDNKVNINEIKYEETYLKMTLKIDNLQEEITMMKIKEADRIKMMEIKYEEMYVEMMNMKMMERKYGEMMERKYGEMYVEMTGRINKLEEEIRKDKEGKSNESEESNESNNNISNNGNEIVVKQEVKTTNKSKKKPKLLDDNEVSEMDDEELKRLTKNIRNEKTRKGNEKEVVAILEENINKLKKEADKRKIKIYSVK